MHKIFKKILSCDINELSTKVKCQKIVSQLKQFISFPTTILVFAPQLQHLPTFTCLAIFEIRKRRDVVVFSTTKLM